MQRLYRVSLAGRVSQTNWQTGPHPGILDLYTVLGGVLALIALGLHGSLYLGLKTQGLLQQRARSIATRLWPAVLAITLVSLPATVIARPHSLQNYMKYPIAFLVPVVVVASLATILIAARRRQELTAFLASCINLAAMLSGAASGLFPALLPTVGTAGRDITIALAAAGPHTLHVGLIWWTLGMLLALLYFSVVYWLFRGKVPLQSDGH